MSGNYTVDPDGFAANNGSSFMSRREARASNVTGALPVIGITGPDHNQHFDFEQMLRSLHDLFEHDRQMASQSDSTRCGLCYLHFTVSELEYREEGFYICTGCAQHINQHRLPMLRKQQKL